MKVLDLYVTFVSRNVSVICEARIITVRCTLLLFPIVMTFLVIVLILICYTETP